MTENNESKLSFGKDYNPSALHLWRMLVGADEVKAIQDVIDGTKDKTICSIKLTLDKVTMTFFVDMVEGEEGIDVDIEVIE